MKYQLVFRNNGFVALYDMDNKQQLFNVPLNMLDKRLSLEFDKNILIQCNIKIEDGISKSPIELPTI